MISILLCFKCVILLSCNQKSVTEPNIEKNKWIAINSGLSDLHIQALVIDAISPKILYASTYHGIFKSNDGGDSWSLANTGMTSNDVKVIRCNPENSNQLFAGSWGDGIYISEDAAATWKSINNGMTDLRIRSISIDSFNQENIFAISDTKFLESTDIGTTWKEINSPYGKLRSLSIDFGLNTAFVGTDYFGIYKRSASGSNWEAISNGLPKEGTYSTVASLQILPGTTTSILAAIRGKGVYHSQNYGQNWQLYSEDLNGIYISCMVVDNKDSDHIIVGAPQGVFMTTDGAQTWQKINNGLTNLDVRAVAIEPKDSRIIYGGTMGGGVFKMILDL